MNKWVQEEDLGHSGVEDMSDFGGGLDFDGKNASIELIIFCCD